MSFNDKKQDSQYLNRVLGEVEGGTRNFFCRLKREFPAAFWIFLGGIFINRSGSLSFRFLAFFLAASGFSQSLAASAIAFWGFGALTASLFGGWSADRFGLKSTLVTGLGLSAVIVTLIPAGTSFPMIISLAFLAGFSYDFQRPAVAATIAHLVKDTEWTKAFGLLYWVGNVGNSIAPLLGSALAEISLRLIFYVDGTCCVIFLVLVLICLPKLRRSESTRPRNPLAALSDRSFQKLFVLSCAISVIMCQANSTLPISMHLKGFGVADYGVAISANGISVVLLSIPISRFLSRCEASSALAIGAALTGFGFFLTQFAGSVVAYAATVIVWTLGQIVIVSLTPVVISRLAPPDKRGVYQGSYALTWGLGLLIGPSIGGWILQNLGTGMLWTICGLLGALVAAGYRSWI